MSTFEQGIRAQAMVQGEWPIFAWQHYHIITCVEDDAVVRVECETNDDDDDGYPDGEITRWTETFNTLDAALRNKGKCRVGVSGVIVTVTLDGEEVR